MSDAFRLYRGPEDALPVVQLTTEEALVAVQMQAFLKARGLERDLFCPHCGEPTEAGTGDVGLKCTCRILTWLVPTC